MAPPKRQELHFTHKGAAQSISWDTFVMRSVALGFGGAAYLIFLATFLYAIARDPSATARLRRRMPHWIGSHGPSYRSSGLSDSAPLFGSRKIEKKPEP